MSKYIIVWNENKTEGVLFLSNKENEDDALDDAFHAGGGMPSNPCSSLADNFREHYGEEQDCHYQYVDIDETKSIFIDKDL